MIIRTVVLIIAVLAIFLIHLILRITTSLRFFHQSIIITVLSQQQQIPPSAAASCALWWTPTPIWIPSYPGSGSEMFRDLVKATTGLGGDNYYANKCSKEPIPFTCKTHWPVIRRYRKIQPQTMVGRFHDKAIFLIRNPRHALPSYFNHEYEVKHKLKRHSQQGSEEEWRKYRDRMNKNQNFLIGKRL